MYILYDDILNNVKKQCKVLNKKSTLAMPKSQAENSFLAGFNKNLSDSGTAVLADIWLGGSDKETEGRWMWIDGTAITRRN